MTRTSADIGAVRPLVAFLKAERERRGLTRYAIATALGCKHNQLAAWEEGRNAPGINYLALWSGLLGHSLGFIPEEQ